MTKQETIEAITALGSCLSIDSLGVQPSDYNKAIQDKILELIATL